jgi:HlyD family secretion protein
MQSQHTPLAIAPARRAWTAANKKWLPWLLVIAALASGAGLWRYLSMRPPPPAQYKTATVVRRAIVGRVTASGTLSALVTVQVGTQVSGRVQKLNADFNTRVTKGQLVAKIDPQLFQAAAEQAQANYLSAEAQLSKAESDVRIAALQFGRAKALHEQSLASQSDLDNAGAAVDASVALRAAARASLAQARAARNQAQVNLSYTSIVSPIDGVVISRNVDVGQTVAASLQAPTLFTIAQDLTKMQVDTSVAEADIGRLQQGMATYFLVDAYPGQRFIGKIRQIRNAAVMLQNVVTYDAVIDVDNGDLRLRPGMTANVTVTYSEKPSALAIPNAALRFHAPPSLAGLPQPALVDKGGAAPDEDAHQPNTLWVMRHGEPRAVVAHVGLTDGTVTELVEGDVREGDELVVEILDAESKNSSADANSLRRLF